ncbi:MAG: hypothetical protein NTZ16_08075, partial [Verrucomicrobia bacterium]|nr:hypothetical protein [Verrucomicrobiota bacterium]
MKIKSIIPATILIALFVGCTSVGVFAKNWVGNTDANFNTAANWSPAAVPASTAALVFTNAGSSGTTLTYN